MEKDFKIATKGEEFSLIKQLEKEVQAKNEPSPATNSAGSCLGRWEVGGEDEEGGGRGWINLCHPKRRRFIGRGIFIHFEKGIFVRKSLIFGRARLKK